MNQTTDEFLTWIGRTEDSADDMSPAKAAAAAALFDQEIRPGFELPPLWHWFYFLPTTPQSELGGDGHARRRNDGFMPPIPYPRRMFAGARLTWHRPLVVGRAARREAEIRDIVKKSGRSGDLAFVTVAYRYFQGGSDQESSDAGSDAGLCLEEEQDIVYRQPGPAQPPPDPVPFPELPSDAWSRTVVPDSRLLFRFSALTFNAHRIHYDRPYAADEGYPGLVVHGPLTAMLLLQLVHAQTDRAVASFRFRGQAPLFDLAPFRLVGVPSQGKVELLAQGPDGKTAMAATAQLSEPSSA